VFLFLTIILSCTGDLSSSPSTTISKNVENVAQGNIILFSQNYSEINRIPNNVFIAKIQNTMTLDSIYSIIYWTPRSEIYFDKTSKELRYITTRNSIVKPRQIGSLYICNLSPMVKCSYEISMDIKADDPQSFVELDTPGSKLMIQKKDNKTVLKSYFQTDFGTVRSKTICIGNNNEKSDFKVVFDGENKTNTIITENGSYIVTPLYNLDRQKLPYIDFSNGYIKFKPSILGEGRYIDVNISSTNQKAARKFITPIGDSKMIAFGLDGPHPRNLTGKGINYLNSKGGSGTLWFDIRYIGCNQTYLEYLRNLVMNDSWEVGIHFSKELNSLFLEEAYKIMDKEYESVYEKIGKKPTSWCSLRNRDSITHAIYAYNKLGIYWRNGHSGVYAEEMFVGNLDDDTWYWWEPASRAGMTHPVFTHQLDKDPAIKYSISSSRFKTWVNNCHSNNVSIVPFYEYSQISRNSYDAYFDNINSCGNLISFDAHTNGVKSFINVNVTAGNDTQVYDHTLNKSLNYTLEKDKSITFWVENNHIYDIYLKHWITYFCFMSLSEKWCDLMQNTIRTHNR
jgi:hypothetical protein